MTQAIRSTIDEYCTSPQPQSTPFSQTRISQKIMSKNLKKTDSLATIDEASSVPPSPKSEAADGSVSSSATLNQPDSPSRSRPNDIAIYPDTDTITPETLTNHMYTAGDPPIDLFVRTSGVERLSNFMMWQCHQDTQLFFLKCMWPDFDLWHFLPVLVEWQWRQKHREMDEKPQRGIKQR